MESAQKHPIGMYTLSITALFQNFGFWGVVSFFPLYLTGEYQSEADATKAYGVFLGIAGWVIPEYRHPSNTSTDFRAPPCHRTSHFGRVCATVAGKPNAAVRDCHACHQVTAWNNIRGVGWYQSH